MMNMLRRIRLFRHHIRPTLERCEQRIAPAIATLANGVLTIDYTATGTTSESVTVTNTDNFISLSGNIVGATSNLTTDVGAIAVHDIGGSNNQSLSLTGNYPFTFTLSGGLSCTDVETVLITRPIKVLGLSSLSVSAPKMIVVSASVTSVDGNISLSANQQNIPTSGNFPGIDVGGQISSSTGNITLIGRGGDDSAGGQCGILVDANVGGGTQGTVSLTGMGGASAGSANHGVSVESGDITSSSSTISVTGQGGANAAQGDGAGVYIIGHISSASGDIVLTGTGKGAGPSNSGDGVSVEYTASISAGGYGSITISGTISANGPHGVGLRIADSISSVNGPITITTHGGVASLGNVKASGAGAISIANTFLGVPNTGIGLQATVSSAGGVISIAGASATPADLDIFIAATIVTTQVAPVSISLAGQIQLGLIYGSSTLSANIATSGDITLNSGGNLTQIVGYVQASNGTVLVNAPGKTATFAK
ncbi:MAG: beta strand repeat-containing protein [Gemmataceae bacterium]